MIDKVKNNPGQFHDPNFARSVVTQVIRAFLQNRIRYGGPSGAFIKNNPMSVSRTQIPRIMFINPQFANPPNNMQPSTSHVPSLIAHEGSHFTEDPVPRAGTPEDKAAEEHAQETQKDFDHVFGVDTFHAYGIGGM